MRKAAESLTNIARLLRLSLRLQLGRWAWLIPALALLYVLLPIDIIPDWLPIIGGVDDIAIVSGAITLFIRVCNPDIVDEIMDRIEGV